MTSSATSYERSPPGGHVAEYADLHIHSCFSIASSRDMLPKNLLGACQMKGITVLGSGDGLHKGWAHLWEPEIENDAGILIVPSAEVEDEDRVHHLLLMEDFESFQTLREELHPFSRDLSHAGRPHIRLPGWRIARMAHQAGGLIGPAHAFTPWTSLYASYSRVSACYREEAIDLLELGLSADTTYGAAIPDLAHVPFLSNSDAHSPRPENIGREFTAFHPSCRTPAHLLDAIRRGDIVMNAGFFPEEGKYNQTACSRCYHQYTLEESVRLSWRCPIDRGLIKKGVADRARELSSACTPGERPPYLHIIPLGSIIQGVKKASSPATKKCREVYMRYIHAFGDEIAVLTRIPPEELGEIDVDVARAISAFREGRVLLTPGGGGKYGSFSLPLP